MNETGRDAQRNILLNWNKLTRSDVSMVQAALSKPDMQIVITTGTAHNYFWTQLVRLGWAIECDVPEKLSVLPNPPASFKLTGLGLELVPEFVAYRDLFWLTIWNNTPEDQRSLEPSRSFAHIARPVQKQYSAQEPVTRNLPLTEHKKLGCFEAGVRPSAASLVTRSSS